MPAGKFFERSHVHMQAIAYIRICRPGSVIGPQQTFLHINEAELWKHGELYRQHHKVIPDAIVPVAAVAQPAARIVPGLSAAVCFRFAPHHVEWIYFA